VATAATLTVSDGVVAGTRHDASGAALADLLGAHGFDVVERRMVADEADLISAALQDLAKRARLVITTGGTGLGPRDVTPEATRTVLDKEVPGLTHLMLVAGIQSTPLAALSRAVAGTIGTCLVINTPGSPRGAVDSLTAVLPVLSHALDLLAGDTSHRG